MCTPEQHMYSHCLLIRHIPAIEGWHQLGLAQLHSRNSQPQLKSNAKRERGAAKGAGKGEKERNRTTHTALQTMNAKDNRRGIGLNRSWVGWFFVVERLRWMLDLLA